MRATGISITYYLRLVEKPNCLKVFYFIVVFSPAYACLSVMHWSMSRLILKSDEEGLMHE